MLRTVFFVLIAITSAANPVAAKESTVVVSASPEVNLGFGRFCHLGGDVVGCTSLQGAIGVRGTTSLEVSPTLSFGVSGSYWNLPSQHFDIWKAMLVGMAANGEHRL